MREKYGYDVRLVGGDDALYSDALGDPGSTGETYIGMVRHNVTVIVTALFGEIDRKTRHMRQEHKHGLTSVAVVCLMSHVSCLVSRFRPSKSTT